ncbi:MAG TPA: efflux RND transporter periplasmic adaptor subunit [Gemmataceae bacterium]|nr:efflux RND transporter periplasmic adaptor subunit [Gemmataceae bacterium]
MGWLSLRYARRWWAWLLGGLALISVTTTAVWLPSSSTEETRVPAGQDGGGVSSIYTSENTVWMSTAQQEFLGIITANVSTGTVSTTFTAPGQVVPDESEYAYITPRAKGIIREVHAQIGQFVNKGDVLVTIDSSEVAQARLNLIDALMRLEVAQAKLNWQESVYHNALDLIEALRKHPDPDEVQTKFVKRPIGKIREQLLTAYTQYHLSRIASARYAALSKKDAVPVALAQQKEAAYQVDKATYQGLMDRMAFEVTLEYTRARQELREARTAVKVAHETLRIYGVPIDKIAKQLQLDVLAGTSRRKDPKKTLEEAAESVVSPTPDLAGLLKVEGEPVSTYELRAPFNGTIMERDRIVPGLVVDGTHRLFTMASLDTMWLEAYVHESDFDLLSRSKGGRVEFTSPAYPDQIFNGRVLYTGDMVDPKSRMVRLLATAQNDHGKLKPGMFVSIEIYSEDVREVPKIPASALLTDNDAFYVFVQTGPESFERRQVVVGRRVGKEAAIDRGLKTGERIVVEGGFELKSKAEAQLPGGGS